MRKDYLIDRWTVIAAARKKRPTDFKRTVQESKQAGVCALEPGNEHMTPPAVLVYLSANGKIRKTKDEDGFRHKDWLIRCVPNLYPAFTPPVEPYNDFSVGKGELVQARATGHHEVLVESPTHGEHPGTARLSQLTHVVNACIERYRELASRPYVKYVSIFRNHGLEAGASLSHAHTQIMAIPFVPKTVHEELIASEQFFRRENHCAFCNILQMERNSPRLIWENDDFVVFAPWASVHPFEFWVVPKKHQTSLLDLSQMEVESFARTLRINLGALKVLLDDPPYNFGYHQMVGAESSYYHWHLEVYPRLSTWAGFEKSTGMFINVVSPEDAARDLQDASLREEAKLKATEK